MRARFAGGWAAILTVASACSSSTDVSNTDAGAANSDASGSGSGSSGASGGSSGSSGAATGADGGSADASGSSSGAAEGGMTSSDAGTDADGAVSPIPYPSGPYCAAAGAGGHLATGCVIPNLTWNGYVDDAADALATTKPYRSYSLYDVYNDARVSGKRYAMINIAEYLCPGCQHSAQELQTGGQAVVQAGGVVVEVVMTDGFTTPAKMGDAATWANKYSLYVTTVADLDPTTPTLNTLGRRDQAYIIDLTTMTVLQYLNGSTGAVTNNSASLAMTTMHTLLGK
jgi:hypothetical protein